MHSIAKEKCTSPISEIERIRTEHVIDMSFCLSLYGERPRWMGWVEDFRSKDGKSIRTNFGFEGADIKGGEKEKSSVHKWLIILHKYVDVALTFLSCKNVVAETQSFPESKKRKHTIHDSDVVYKTLVVLLPGQRQSGNGNKSDPQNNVRLHVCRGHFADHREHGLFGKDHLRGIYWVPMHAKGNKEVGEVIKRYALRPRTPTPPAS